MANTIVLITVFCYFFEVGNGHEGPCDNGLMRGDNYFPFSSSLG